MRAGVALAALALAACAPAPAAAPAIDIAAETKALEAASNELHTGDRPTQMSLYLDEAEMIPPGGAVTGAAEIKRIYGASECDPGVRFARASLQLAASADMAVERGRWSVADDPNAGGDYVIVWRKDAQGAWRVLYDLSNDAGPAR